LWSIVFLKVVSLAGCPFVTAERLLRSTLGSVVLLEVVSITARRSLVAIKRTFCPAWRPVALLEAFTPWPVARSACTLIIPTEPRRPLVVLVTYPAIDSGLL
jgi:hypothetical protein